MTAVLDETSDTAVAEVTAVEPPASWTSRAGAFALDVVLPLAVIAVLALCALAAGRWTIFWSVIAVGAAVIAFNRIALPAVTGWSLGRAYFGIAVRRRDGTQPGLPRLILRDLAHLLDTAALFLGWLWPLWDSRRRTFADLLTRTEVHRVPRPERNVRKPVLIAFAVAVLASALAITLTYLTAYRQEQAVSTAREQIAEQGPRIVEQVLSYNADTMKDDFARAQSLVTDSYREQLTAQQQAVEKAGATGNEYWAVSSAVLSVNPDQAAMLLAMQGQRGTDPKTLRFITATVRADFDRDRDGHWRVNQLTVLKKPQMGPGQ